MERVSHLGRQIESSETEWSRLPPKVFLREFMIHNLKYDLRGKLQKVAANLPILNVFINFLSN